MIQIDLVVNCFERNYRATLAPGRFPGIQAENLRSFCRRVALINNVDDPGDARRRAQDLIARGEIDEFHFVADRLDEALATTGLTRDDLGRIPHYSDCALVAVTLPGAPWILYWDAEVWLVEPVNWVDPALRLMDADRRVFSACPTSWRGEIRWLTMEVKCDFALSYMFSDAVFLARRDELARPIYRELCVASLRYPLAHIGAVFEQRLDSHMRRSRRLGASYLGAVYQHPESEGAAYPAETRLERWRKRINYYIIRALAYSCARHPHLVVNCRPRANSDRRRLEEWKRLWVSRGVVAG